MAGVSGEMRTAHLPNTNLERYLWINLFGSGNLICKLYLDEVQVET
jgi:hypothetical protein